MRQQGLDAIEHKGANLRLIGRRIDDDLAHLALNHLHLHRAFGHVLVGQHSLCQITLGTVQRRHLRHSTAKLVQTDRGVQPGLEKLLNVGGGNQLIANDHKLVHRDLHSRFVFRLRGRLCLGLRRLELGLRLGVEHRVVLNLLLQTARQVLLVKLLRRWLSGLHPACNGKAHQCHGKGAHQTQAWARPNTQRQEGQMPIHEKISGNLQTRTREGTGKSTRKLTNADFVDQKELLGGYCTTNTSKNPNPPSGSR